MGRIKKYLTEEAKQLAIKERAHNYYWTNKQKCDEQQRKRDQFKRDNKKML